MAGPLTTLHAELSGLLFVALLMAIIHPDADDQDVGWALNATGGALTPLSVAVGFPFLLIIRKKAFQSSP